MNTTKKGRTPPEYRDQFDVGETADSLARLVDGFTEFGDVFRIYAPTRGSYTYVVSAPELVKRVLSSNHRNYRKGVGIDRVAVLLGKGLMVSEGDFWRQQRRMVQPLFHRRAIHRFFSVMQQCTLDLISEWEPLAAAGTPVNITEQISEVTLQVILRAIFGDDLEPLQRDHPFSVVSQESARDLRFAAKFRALTRPIRALIARRRNDPAGHEDLLQLLLSARDKDTQQPMSEQAVVDEVMTLIVAGHETTASSLNWLWYLVSQHRQAGERIQSELAGLPDNHKIDPRALLSLDFTKRVVDETLRMYPPGWLLTRRATRDDRLGEFKIPAGADVFISPYLIHRHPQHWQDADSFDPDRFSDEQTAMRHSFAYLPFGAGPRRCVGDAFAAAEMQLHVAMIAQHFRLRYEAQGAVTMEAAVNLRSKDPFIMQLQSLAT